MSSTSSPATNRQIRRYSYATCSNSGVSARPRLTSRWNVPRLGFQRYYAIEVKKNEQFGNLTEDQYAKSSHRYKKLAGKDIHKIFGPGMDSRQGNSLLNTVQKQRVTGTLDADISGPSVTKVTIAKALTWLRKNYPLDEDAAIVARLEREDIAIRDWQPQQDADPDNLYGNSAFEELRARNQAKEKEREEAEKAEEERLRKQAEKSGPLAVKRKSEFKEIARPRKTADWVEKYREKAKLSNLTEPPEVNRVKALVSSGLFVLAGLALCVGLAIEYEPPPREARIFPNLPPAAATVGAIIALNVMFFFFWKIPPLWRFMNMNMLMVPATPNPFSLLGGIFSHQLLFHLVVNMTLLWVVGTPLHDEVGRGRFLAIYLGCGLCGAYVSLTRFVATKFWTITGLGASGAVYGVISTFLSLTPEKDITLWIIPQELQTYLRLPAQWIWWLVFFFEARNIYRGSLSADHFAHMGGILSGVVAAEALKRHSRAKRRRFTEDHPTFNPLFTRTQVSPAERELESKIKSITSR